MNETCILLAEDDDAIAEAVAANLKREGMTVQRVADGLSALEAASHGAYHLLLLDVMMPGLDGFEVCRRLRAAGHDLPVLMLTARSDDVDQVLGLGLGADDYILKPFSGPALTARVKAHLRRYRELKGSSPAQKAELLRFGALEIDLAACIVRLQGESIPLTAKEFELLRFLAANRGRVLSRQQLYRQVWGDDFLSDENTVTVHLSRLREKIEPDPGAPRMIVTVRGLGYRFTGGV